MSIPNQYQLLVNHQQTLPHQQQQLANSNFGVVTSSLNFAKTDSPIPNNNNNNIVYGQNQNVLNHQHHNYNNYNAESRSDPIIQGFQYDVIPNQKQVTSSSKITSSVSDNHNNRPFPSFILNPRAASSVYTNRVARKVPKAGIQTRFINNVPIRQWQWPDYVDQDDST